MALVAQGGSVPSSGSAASIGDWLSDREYEITTRLERATLVIEAHPGPAAAEDIARAYAQQAARLAGPGVSPGAALVRKYPALTLLTLVSHASATGRTSDFWESYWAALGIARDSKTEADLRQAIPKLLRRFSLAEFPRLRGRYVHILSVHAGVPVPHVAALVGVLADHLARGGEPNGSSFTNWLTDPRKPHRLARVDVPVRTFITEGGEFAIDFIDRVLDIVAVSMSNPSTWHGTVGTLAVTSGLPDVIFQQAVAAITELEQPGSERGLLAGDGHIEPPRLRLDIADGAVQLLVPHPPAQPGDRWQISADGDVTDVRVPGSITHPANPAWMTAPHALHTITSPARHVSAEHPSIPRRFVYSLVDPKDPLVLFTDGGKLLGRRLPVPLGTVYALVPRGHQVVDSVAGKAVEPDADRGHPAGWDDWQLLQIDTTERRSLQLVKGTDKVGTVRLVRRSYLPEVLLADPLRGVRAANGSPLYNERPAVWLPGDALGHKVQWRVSARRLGSAEWVATFVWTLEGEDFSCDPFDEVTAGLFGTYEIVVRGPLGADLRKVVHLAEGLDVSVSPDYRVPARGGQSESLIELTCDSALTAEPGSLHFGSDESEKVAVVRGAGALPLLVHPPQAEIRLYDAGTQGGSAPVPWSALPHVVTVQELSEDRILAYRVPATTDINTWVELRDRSGKVRLQEPPGYNEYTDAFEVSTARLAAGLGRLRAARITAVVQAEGEDPHFVDLANVRPAGLCSEIRLDGDALVFDDLAEVAGLAAQIWPESAPWMEMVVLPVREERVALPGDLVAAGPLRVRLVVSDQATAAATPPPDTVRLPQAGWVRSGDPAMDALACCLAGEADLPSGLAPSPHMWTALHVLSTADDHEEVRAGLGAMLREQPREAVLALTHSTIPVSEQPALLISTGLAQASFEIDDPAGATGANSWVQCLVTLADLPQFQRGGEEWETAREELDEQGGEALLRVLDTGRDTELAKALFDHTTVMLHHMPAEQVDQIFNVARIIPGAVLDVDTRVSAIAEAFAMRERWAETTSHTELIVRAKKFVRAIRKAGKQFYDQIAIRSDALGTADTQAHPWLMIPMVSLIMALLARLEAHGGVKDGVIDSDVMGAWADLARLCPQLTRIDLVFAESLIVHARIESGLTWK
ncbi:hypothetical protein ONR57_01880 [Hoyosella sp. YIM 151337]|uniref:hypothetical protein n=1 Tax=Hoyosella sp. YIM 151337 TaxID=2992742 RepID=UPI002235CA57|nr:hypothetical protein [Hoyosella sp. YIM 151337]MCW4352045.1 hypothetical protein [Hoyosella sp. YIM 151337]